MNIQKKEYINYITSSIIESFELENSFPLPIEELVKKLKGIITEAKLEEDVDAKIQRINTDNYNFIITLPQDTFEKRRRFSIAHELGHLFLHMGYLINDEKWNEIKEYPDLVFYRKSNQKQIEEYEANEFAGSLLMPKDDFINKVRDLIDSNGYCNIKELANYFEVSVEAATVRGKTLNIFPNIW